MSPGWPLASAWALPRASAREPAERGRPSVSPSRASDGPARSLPAIPARRASRARGRRVGVGVHADRRMLACYPHEPARARASGVLSGWPSGAASAGDEGVRSAPSRLRRGNIGRRGCPQEFVSARPGGAAWGSASGCGGGGSGRRAAATASSPVGPARKRRRARAPCEWGGSLRGGRRRAGSVRSRGCIEKERCLVRCLHERSQARANGVCASDGGWRRKRGSRSVHRRLALGDRAARGLVRGRLVWEWGGVSWGAARGSSGLIRLCTSWGKLCDLRGRCVFSAGRWIRGRGLVVTARWGRAFF